MLTATGAGASMRIRRPAAARSAIFNGTRGGHRPLLLLLATLVMLMASTCGFATGCKLIKIAQFPITMEGLDPLMTARINDVDVQFVVDSGAFYSMISAASAAQLKLRTSPILGSFYVTGVHGAAEVSITTVKTFTLVDVPIHNVDFLVGGSEAGQGSIGLLGQNVLHIADAEYDLGQGMIRLMKPEDCGTANLAYWAGTSTPYSVVDLISDPAVRTARFSHAYGSAYVNGEKIRVMFDEEIQHTRLRIGDIDLKYSDMLIGADFFLSHRIYVANSQHKLYFTYNGGPVFNLTTNSHPVTGAATDAADYSRRGAAFAARGEFDQALTAASRACELVPDNPDYLFQRGMLYWQLKQPDPAMADFDQALKLKPDSLRPLSARAQLLLQRGDDDRAATDLDAADAIAPKEADERYQIANDYLRADRLAPAIGQLNLWIESHHDDARLPEAMRSRCWIRALLDVDLPLAVKDCDAALRHAEKSSPFYSAVTESRGLVFLRMGNYEKSLADYHMSIRIRADNAWSLYGRGIDKLRKGDTSGGEADIAQATAISPRIVEDFKRHGIVP
jgi:tetratricopeptide (TPR) repeat protein